MRVAQTALSPELLSLEVLSLELCCSVVVVVVVVVVVSLELCCCPQDILISLVVAGLEWRENCVESPASRLAAFTAASIAMYTVTDSSSGGSPIPCG